MELNSQQLEVVKMASKWLKSNTSKQVFRLYGAAGTGKTTVAKYFAQEMGITPNYAAFTGKAAVVLHKNGCIGATTIHSLIYKVILNEKTGEVKFILNDESPLCGAELLIVDEISMVSVELAMDLLKFGVKILVLGDPYQLPPPNGAGYFTNEESDYTLTEIHRQAKGSAIIDIATRAREKKNIDYGVYGNSVLVTKKDKNFSKYLMKANQILVGKNSTRVFYNEQFRKLCGFNNSIPNQGEKLICLKNNKEKNIFNGGTFIVNNVKEFHKSYKISVTSEDFDNVAAQFVNVRKEFFTNTEKELKWQELNKTEHFYYGYAITVHKCVHPNTLVETDQGFMEIKNINNEGKISSTNVSSYRNKVYNHTMNGKEFKTKNGYSVRVTDEHGMLIIRNGVEQSVPANEVLKGDFVKLKLFDSIDRAYVTIPKIERGDVREIVYNTPDILTEDVGLLMGLMVADGSISGKRIQLYKRHEDVSLKFNELMRCIFGIEMTYKTGEGCFGYEKNSSYLYRWFLDKGMKPNSKSIPDLIKRSPFSVQKSFFRGLFEDGTVSKKGHIEFSTKEYEIAHYTHVWLLKIGVISSLKFRNGIYSIYIYSSQFEKFKEVGFVSKFKNDRLDMMTSKETKYGVPIHKDILKSWFKKIDIDGYEKNHVYPKTTARYRLSEYSKQIDIGDYLDYHYEEIVDIENDFFESMCVEVPETGLFMQNGMLLKNSQGSQWDNVILFDESGCFGDDWSKWLYTGITRAAKKLIIIK